MADWTDWLQIFLSFHAEILHQTDPFVMLFMLISPVSEIICRIMYITELEWKLGSICGNDEHGGEGTK